MTGTASVRRATAKVRLGRLRDRALHLFNRAIRPTNFKVEMVRTTTWDLFFAEWIAKAKLQGVDPNDLGDEAWGNDQLAVGLAEFYGPLVRPDAVILELGPGSGRLTRHLIGNVRHLVLADFSKPVCDWLEEYLRGRGSFEIHHLRSPGFDWLAAESVDAAVAHGVVEHLDPEVLTLYLGELRRVMRPGAKFVFTFDDLTADEALPILRSANGEVRPQRFRLYHPKAIETLADLHGFDAAVTPAGERLSFAVLEKRAVT